MKNVAIILAGGAGHRLGEKLPKQFLEINNKTVLAHTIEKFNSHPAIDEITVVIHKDYIETTRNIIHQEGFDKVRHIVPGGKERYHSTLAALSCYPTPGINLLIHDAARLLVSPRIIDYTIEALKTCSACTTAIPATDTILQCDQTKGFIQAILDRSMLFQVQTPQGFHSEILQEAYKIALTDPNFHCTDDCGVIQRYLPHVPIKIVPGESTNIKLTYKEDIPVIENILLQMQ